MFHEVPKSCRKRAVCSPTNMPAMVLRTQMGIQGGWGMSLGHNFGYSPGSFRFRQVDIYTGT